MKTASSPSLRVLTPGLSLIPVVCALAGTPSLRPGPATAAEDPDLAMNSDRPDTTESAFTTAKGRWQFELETVSVSLDGRQRNEDWGSVDIKYGLSNHTDVRLITPAWHAGDGADGWTDTELRFRWNLSGRERLDGAKEDNPVAVALMPFVKLPTASHNVGNGDVEGGLIIPITFSKLSLSTMIEADVIRNEADNGYTSSFTLSASYDFDITESLSCFAELAAVLPVDGAAETYFDTGLIYQFNPNFSIDAGVDIGLNDDATDLRLFTGMTRRF